MNYNFCVSRSRLASAVGGSPDLRQLARKDAKYRCLFFSKIAIHISICAERARGAPQQRQKYNSKRILKSFGHENPSMTRNMALNREFYLSRPDFPCVTGVLTQYGSVSTIQSLEIPLNPP
jgi:hypothetical protein